MRRFSSLCHLTLRFVFRRQQRIFESFTILSLCFRNILQPCPDRAVVVSAHVFDGASNSTTYGDLLPSCSPIPHHPTPSQFPLRRTRWSSRPQVLEPKCRASRQRKKPRCQGSRQRQKTRKELHRFIDRMLLTPGAET